ncbi:MAG: EamA family transporter [Actinomycetota bacterium]
MGSLAYLAIASAAVLWAFGGAFARTLIDRGAPVVELTAGRSWVALVGTALIAAAATRRRADRPRQGDDRGMPHPALLAVFGLSLALANFTYYLAVGLLPVAVAVVFQYTAPGLVVAWSALVEQRRLSRRVLGALGMALAGVALLSEVHRALIGGSPLRPAGVAAAMASAVGFAAYMITGERVGRMLGAQRAVFAGFAVSSVFWALVQLVLGRPKILLDASYLPAILFLGAVTTIVPFLLFVWGLERVDASSAGVVSTLEPVAAALIAFVWLGQSLRPLQVAGAALVIAGIGLIQLDRPLAEEQLQERAAVE